MYSSDQSKERDDYERLLRILTARSHRSRHSHHPHLIVSQKQQNERMNLDDMNNSGCCSASPRSSIKYANVTPLDVCDNDVQCWLAATERTRQHVTTSEFSTRLQLVDAFCVELLNIIAQIGTDKLKHLHSLVRIGACPSIMNMNIIGSPKQAEEPVPSSSSNVNSHDTCSRTESQRTSSIASSSSPSISTSLLSAADGFDEELGVEDDATSSLVLSCRTFAEEHFTNVLSKRHEDEERGSDLVGGDSTPENITELAFPSTHATKHQKEDEQVNDDDYHLELLRNECEYETVTRDQSWCWQQRLRDLRHKIHTYQQCGWDPHSILADIDISCSAAVRLLASGTIPRHGYDSEL
eukprot:PhM_4_TR18023/c0_g1_i5/m.93209